MTEFSSVASFGTAFAAGLLSVFSPCVLPLMPAYLSLVSGVSVEEMQDMADDHGLRRRVLLSCTGFVAGFSTIFIVLGAGAVMVGHVLRTWRGEIFGFDFGVAQLAGIVLFLMGLHLTGILPLHLLYREQRIHLKGRRTSFLWTYVAGAAFGFGWSPCIGPILAGILSIAGSRETVGQGVALLAVYSAGLGVPFFLAGWSIEFFFRTFEKVKHHFRKVEIASGGLLMIVGMLILSDNLTSLNRYFMFLNRFIYAVEEAIL